MQGRRPRPTGEGAYDDGGLSGGAPWPARGNCDRLVRVLMAISRSDGAPWCSGMAGPNSIESVELSSQEQSDDGGEATGGRLQQEHDAGQTAQQEHACPFRGGRLDVRYTSRYGEKQYHRAVTRLSAVLTRLCGVPLIGVSRAERWADWSAGVRAVSIILQGTAILQAGE